MLGIKSPGKVEQCGGIKAQSGGITEKNEYETPCNTLSHNPTENIIEWLAEHLWYKRKWRKTGLHIKWW